MSSPKPSGRSYGRLTRHERDTVQRMLERGASCRQIARELGRSPSTVSSEVASHRFVTAPRERRGERVDASADLSAACPRLAAWPRCCNGCGRYRAIGCTPAPRPGRWTPSRAPGATPPGSSRPCTARADSSWRCRCRTARAPRSWRHPPPCAGSSARTARGAPSAPCSPTTEASSPTKAPSRRCPASATARPGSSTATPGRASRRARARRTTWR